MQLTVLLWLTSNSSRWGLGAKAKGQISPLCVLLTSMSKHSPSLYAIFIREPKENEVFVIKKQSLWVLMRPCYTKLYQLIWKTIIQTNTVKAYSNHWLCISTVHRASWFYSVFFSSWIMTLGKRRPALKQMLAVACQSSTFIELSDILKFFPIKWIKHRDLFEKAAYAMKDTKIILWNQYSISNQIWDV